MPVYPLILVSLLALFCQKVFALNSADILPPEQAFKLAVVGHSREQVTLEWQIADGYHLYRDKTQLQSQTDAIQLGEFAMPEGVAEHDPMLGETRVYRKQLKISLPLLNPQHQPVLKLFVKYQGCADKGICYPPQKRVVDVELPEAPLSAAQNGITQFVKGLKSITPGLFNSELLPPEQAFQFFASLKDDHTVHVSWLIAEGYYLYKDKLGLKLDEVTQTQLAKWPLPTGVAHRDEEFGQVEVYRHDLSLDVPLNRQSTAAETITLNAKFQGCADRGVCYPPMQTAVVLNLPEIQALPPVNPAKADTVISEQDQIVASLKQENLLLTWLTFFGFGVLLAFTPCIFPMIPILSGIIVGNGQHISTRKGFFLSLSYVTAHALMYTLFGVLAALFGSNLQASFQHPGVIAAFAGLFVVLSLSMFGFYNLELPKTVQAMAILRSSSDKHRDGSYWGAGIMGAFSALIVGPCVAAPLAAALIYIGQTGDVWLGGSALFVMGFGMGLPLLLLGASAGRLLPKAGAWLNSTKSVFGVIMLAVAVWMLSRILPAAVTLLLWAMLLIIPAIYLNALEPLPQPASGWKKLWKGLGLIMLVFGILQLIGLSAGNGNPLQPLAGLAAGGKAETKQGLNFQRVRNVAELEEHIRRASNHQQKVMLDFYAEWCISCKELEAFTFTDPQVKQQLAQFVLLQADVTDNNAEDVALLKRFNLIGPPGIIFFDASGQEITASRVIGNQDAPTFIKTLQQL